MAPAKKKLPSSDALSALVAKYAGVSTTKEELEEQFENLDTTSERYTYKVRADVAEQNGILRQVHYAHSMVWKICKTCKREFQTVYCYDEFCSPSCRDDEFKRHFGLTSSGLKQLTKSMPASFWEYEQYQVVSPDMVEALKVFCTHFLEGYEQIKKKSETQYQNSDQSEKDPTDDLTPLELEEAALPTLADGSEQESDNQYSLSSLVDDEAQQDRSPFDLTLIDDVLDYP